MAVAIDVFGNIRMLSGLVPFPINTTMKEPGETRTDDGDAVNPFAGGWYGAGPVPESLHEIRANDNIAQQNNLFIIHHFL